MTFLNLGILTAGAVAVAIPVIIHLLMRRRRQPVMWGAMRFIIEAYRATRRRLLVERWLLLATRCLLVLAIAVALGRPILSTLSAPESRGRTVVILIDDSLTAAVERGGAGGGSALDAHKRTAAGIIDALAEGDRVGVIALGAPVQGIVTPPSSDHAGVKRLIDALTPTDARADVQGAMQLARQQLGESDQPAAPGTKLVAVLSDWLEGSADLQGVLPKAPAGVRIAALPPAEGVDGVGITRIAPMREVVLPGDTSDTQTVTVTLLRSGPGLADAQTSTVRVRLAGTDGAALTSEQQATVRFAPGERSASATIALDAGAAGAGGAGGAGAARSAVLVAELTRDALSRDDVWRLPIDTRPSLKVGVIAERGGTLVQPGTAADLTPAQWLLLALRPTEQQPIDVTELEPTGLDAARTSALDAVFVLEPQRLDEGAWSRLAAYARGGGLVVVTPPSGAGVHTWSDAMTAGLGVPWRLARTAREIDSADPKHARLSAASVLSAGDAGDLLAAIRGELPELVSAVSVHRVLAPTFAGSPAPTGGGESAEQGMTVLLSMDDGTPIVVSARPGAPTNAAPGRVAEAGISRGAIVYLSCALDVTWTDLPAKPLMVPLMQELLRQGLSRARPALWTVAGVPARLPPGTVELQSTALNTGSGLPPTTAVGASVPAVRRAGVLTARDALGVVRAVLAVNPDALAQRTGGQAPAAVGAWLSTAVADGGEPLVWMARGADGAGTAPGAETKTIAQLLAARLDGTPSGSWWLAAALVLALIEVVLARRVSHAFSGGTAPGGRAHA